VEKQVPFNVCRKVAKCVTRQEQVTYTRMVAKCVPRQVAYEVCRMVPVQECAPQTCSSCGTTDAAAPAEAAPADAAGGGVDQSTAKPPMDQPADDSVERSIPRANEPPTEEASPAVDPTPGKDA
jgi:hypothetical protein